MRTQDGDLQGRRGERLCFCWAALLGGLDAGYKEGSCVTTPRNQEEAVRQAARQRHQAALTCATMLASCNGLPRAGLLLC